MPALMPQQSSRHPKRHIHMQRGHLLSWPTDLWWAQRPVSRQERPPTTAAAATRQWQRASQCSQCAGSTGASSTWQPASVGVGKVGSLLMLVWRPASAQPGAWGEEKNHLHIETALPPLLLYLYGADSVVLRAASLFKTIWNTLQAPQSPLGRSLLHGAPGQHYSQKALSCRAVCKHSKVQLFRPAFHLWNDGPNPAFAHQPTRMY